MSLDELKSQLSEFIVKHAIAKFEADDIVELITEGESLDWVVNQLKGDASIDDDEIIALLTEIKKQVGGEQESPAPVVESEVSDLSQLDLAQIDMSQIDEVLPEGMSLPPGMDANELKGLLESPQGKIMMDFAVFCQEKGIDLGACNPNDSRVGRLQNEWQSTPRAAFNGKTPGEMLAQEKVKTFRREEPRVGRNDPCPCGSGKKYKKCCGRD
jgi:hypothetical protein